MDPLSLIVSKSLTTQSFVNHSPVTLIVPNGFVQPNGLPTYMTFSKFPPSHNPSNPASLFAVWAEFATLYYPWTGDRAVIGVCVRVCVCVRARVCLTLSLSLSLSLTLSSSFSFSFSPLPLSAIDHAEWMLLYMIANGTTPDDASWAWSLTLSNSL